MEVNLQSKRERKKQAARQNILQETIELIHEFGVVGTKIEDICQQANITKRTFYTHFASKDDLVMAICNGSILQRTGIIVDEAIEQLPSITERVNCVFDELKTRIDSTNPLQRELIQFLVTNLSANSDSAKHQLDYMQSCFVRLYTASTKEIDNSASPEFYADMTVGMIQAVLLNWLYRDDYDLTNAYDSLAKTVIKILSKP